MEYGNAHRLLLRTIASRGVITFENCMKLFKTLPDFNNTTIQTVIKAINKEIKPFQQNIKIVIDELTSEQKVVFLSLGCDDATKSQNIFSAKELNYFRILIEKIMTTENREITIMDALNFASELTPALKKIDAEEILNIWCTTYYLEKNEHSYALGIRAIHEFERYLEESLPDIIQKCYICHKNVFRGVTCPSCNNSVHTLCLKVYMEKVNKWPCCTNNVRSSQMRRSNSSVLTQTQLLQTQRIERNSSSEPMEVSQTVEEIEANTSVRPRKRRRLSSD